VLDSVMLASMVRQQQLLQQESNSDDADDDVKMESMLDFDTLIDDDPEDEEIESCQGPSCDILDSTTATLISNAAEAVAKSATLIEPIQIPYAAVDGGMAGGNCMSVWEAAGFTVEEVASLAQFGLDTSFMTAPRPTTLADDALSLLNQPVPLDASLAAALAGLYAFDSSAPQHQQNSHHSSAGFNDDRFCFDSPLTPSSTSSPFKTDFGCPLTPGPDTALNSMDFMVSVLPMTDVHRPRRGSSSLKDKSMRAIAPRVCSNNLPTPKSSSPLSFGSSNGPMRRPTLERDYISHSVANSPYYRGSVSPPKPQLQHEQPQQLVWINTITPGELTATNASQLRRHSSWHGQR